MTTTEYRQFIGGEWTGASGGATFEDLDPYSGRGRGHSRRRHREDARRAIEARPPSRPGRRRRRPSASRSSWPPPTSWSAAPTRSSACWPSPQGPAASPTEFGMFQMGFVPGLLRQAAALAYSPIGQILGRPARGHGHGPAPAGRGGPRHLPLERRPDPVRTQDVAPLALGNTVVAKPSEESPFVGGLLWGEIFAEAGLPDGVLGVVTAPGEGRAHRRGADRAPGESGSSTPPTPPPPAGSWPRPPAGTSSGSCARLGGLNPLLVLDDADLDYAVDASAFGAYLHQGQICMSARRLLVDRRVADSYQDNLAAKTAGLKVGSPAEPGVVIGPLINRALDTVAGRVADAVAEGAKVLAGGERVGRCFDDPAGRRPRRQRPGPAGDLRAGGHRRGRRRRRGGRGPGQRHRLRPDRRDRRRPRPGPGPGRPAPGRHRPRQRPAGPRRAGALRGRQGQRLGPASAARPRSTSSPELKWVTVQSGTRPFPF